MLQNTQMIRSNLLHWSTPSQRHCRFELFKQDLYSKLYTLLSFVLSGSANINGMLRVGSLTASPQIAILPRKQKSAPNAIALNMSDPLRTPPSIPIWIWPFAIGAHCLKESIVAGTPSNCRPPWLDITTPSTPAAIACSTSSGDEIPLSHICILVCVFSQGMISSHSRVSSKAWGPLSLASGAPNSSSPFDNKLGNERSFGNVKFVRISPNRRPSTGTSTERKSAWYPDNAVNQQWW